MAVWTKISMMVPALGVANKSAKECKDKSGNVKKEAKKVFFSYLVTIETMPKLGMDHRSNLIHCFQFQGSSFSKCHYCISLLKHIEISNLEKNKEKMNLIQEETLERHIKEDNPLMKELCWSQDLKTVAEREKQGLLFEEEQDWWENVTTENLQEPVLEVYTVE
ncbi:unnamed protein product [Mytilus edulis]|uniref:Uncharacterized protein n=1 Tax=Mytilus edulis TaxID=6550 RepID=A0A8S3RH42_MYTED|nr:unnamed protein product [Mytilus edulis]